LRQGGADEAGGAGNQDAHGWNPVSAGLRILPAAACVAARDRLASF
jgi:hypothetical protein